jgi:ATP-binding cassette, subfamily D (ALD), member 4
MGGILAYLVLAIPIFTHMYDNYTPTELAQLISNYSFKCQYLIYLFTRLYDILTEISVIAGNSMRIGELIDKMNENIRISRKVFNKNLKLTQSLSDDTCLILTNVTITTPDKMKLLIKNVNLEFVENKRVLISGRSGCGKTSLFRCINGLWKSFTGEIIINEKNKPFFLPQVSYFTCGSLLEQISYPTINQIQTISETERAEQLLQVIEWLKLVDLEHLLEKINFDVYAKPSFDWSTILSAGNLPLKMFILKFMDLNFS